MSNIGKKVFTASILLFLIPACARLSLCPDNCDNINIIKIEKEIDLLAEQGKIRKDQAEARRKDLRKEWAEYQSGDLSCKRLLLKIDYHRQP